LPLYRLDGTLPLVTPPAHKHDDLLPAAGHILRRHGSFSLALDAVAAEAGANKGG